MTKDEIRRLREMHDEDIDLSDIPELTDEELARARPAREYLKDIARRNRAVLARMICDEEEGSDIAVAAAEALVARTMQRGQRPVGDVFRSMERSPFS